MAAFYRKTLIWHHWVYSHLRTNYKFHRILTMIFVATIHEQWHVMTRLRMIITIFPDNIFLKKSLYFILPLKSDFTTSTINQKNIYKGKVLFYVVKYTSYMYTDVICQYQIWLHLCILKTLNCVLFHFSDKSQSANHSKFLISSTCCWLTNTSLHKCD